MKPLTISFILVVLAGIYFFPQAEAPHAAGILAPGEPSQSPCSATSWEYRGHRITALADYSIRARVLMREPYWMGREARLSPVDFTVGWGFMSDDATLEQLRLGRGYRRATWQPRTAAMTARLAEINTHAANMHLIPATDAIASALNAVRRSEVVEMGGRLVLVEAPDGWHWRSSLTREDTGDGACELMWVEWLRVEPTAPTGG